jgi:hypothetical protein
MNKLDRGRRKIKLVDSVRWTLGVYNLQKYTAGQASSGTRALRCNCYEVKLGLLVRQN